MENVFTELPTEGCQAIDGKCIRVSPFPERFEAASAKCRSEGSFLLSILDPSVIPPIKDHIEMLSSTRIRLLPIFSPDISSYWVGGHVSNDHWTWQANGKNFSKYSNWFDNKINAGCIQNICTSNYKLTVQVAEDYSWKAEDYVQRKYYGYEIDEKKPVVVSTWQSLATFDKEYFVQNFGTAMGPSVAPTYANTFMDNLEQFIFKCNPNGITNSYIDNITSRTR